MRLAYVCADPGVPVFGRKGCSIHVQEVLRALGKGGVQVVLFAAKQGGDPPAGLETIPVVSLPKLSQAEPAAREQQALATNLALHQALQQHGPFDAVYERYSLWSFTGMEYARSTGIPGLLEVNAPLIEEQDEHRGLTDRASAERVAEWVFRDASALIAVSEEVKTYIERFPTTQGRVHVVPNGVDPERFSPYVAPSYPAPPGVFTVGFVGTLKPWHGLPVLLKAFAILHRYTSLSSLLIVGDGPERENLKAMLVSDRVEAAVHFTGAVAPQAVPGLLTSMDVAVVPASNQDNYYFSPLKLYEYMAAGRPVVASRIGQIGQLIQNDVNGVLCSPGDSIALAEALKRLLCDETLRTRLGRAARATVAEDHSWASVVQHILHLARLETPPSTSLAEVRL